MVTDQSIQKQLKHIGFKTFGWGRGEVRELSNIILPEEVIFECVNGIYEGGFALLIGTDVRVLLVDKKPLNHLTVEDLRFDMINQIDYSHRLLGANITISTGIKTLKFRSYNQPRLRKLIGHIQHCMAEDKKKQANHDEGQNQRLEQINHQLQSYLMVQHQHQQELREQLLELHRGKASVAGALPVPEGVRPSPELSNYLLAQNLLAQYQQQTGQAVAQSTAPASYDAALSGQQPVPANASGNLAHTTDQQTPTVPTKAAVLANPTMPTKAAVPASGEPSVDIYADGMKEVFGKRSAESKANPASDAATTDSTGLNEDHLYHPDDRPRDGNPLRIAYSKLPLLLRARKFGRRDASGEAA